MVELKGPVIEIAYLADRIRITLGYFNNPNNDWFYTTYDDVQSVRNPFARRVNIGQEITVLRSNNMWIARWVD